jgi:hypothetical protein
MKLFILLAVVFSFACNESAVLKLKEDGLKYEIVCKHPLGHIEKYPVDFNTFWSPSNHRGGIFRFHTTDGRIVRSSFCHSEAKH